MSEVKRVAILYLPVLHQGYWQFLHQNLDEIWLLDESVMDHFSWYKKDIRRLDLDLVKTAVLSWSVCDVVELINQKQLTTKISKMGVDATFILPDDEVSAWLIEQYLAQRPTELVPVFLRWDKHQLAPASPIADRSVSLDAKLEGLVQLAAQAATNSTDWWRHVGCVLAREGQVLVTGWNQHLPTSYSPGIDGDVRSLFTAGEATELVTSIHAEAMVIAQAAKQGVVTAGSELLVTVFPCPLCAKQIAQAGIKRVYYIGGYSLLDAATVLEQAGVELVQITVSAEQLAQINQLDESRHILAKY